MWMRAVVDRPEPARRRGLDVSGEGGRVESVARPLCRQDRRGDREREQSDRRLSQPDERSWNDINGNYFRRNLPAGANADAADGEPELGSPWSRPVCRRCAKGYGAGLSTGLRRGSARQIGAAMSVTAAITATGTATSASRQPGGHPADYATYCVTGPADSRLPAAEARKFAAWPTSMRQVAR